LADTIIKNLPNTNGEDKRNEAVHRYRPVGKLRARWGGNLGEVVREDAVRDAEPKTRRGDGFSPRCGKKREGKNRYKKWKTSTKKKKGKNMTFRNHDGNDESYRPGTLKKR